MSLHQVDHAIAVKHGGATNEINLVFACTLCNRRKGSDLSSIDPESGEIVRLYNPRTDFWDQHFRLDGTEIIPMTPVARATVALLDLNSDLRKVERRYVLDAGFQFGVEAGDL